MLLIGSRALEFRAPFLRNRPPKDFDFIARKDEINSWLADRSISGAEEIDKKVIVEKHAPPLEFEVITPGSSAEMLHEIVENDPKTIKTEFGLVPNFQLLFALKASHRYLKNSPSFWKTATDYHKMKSAGGKILPEYMEFFKLREKETYTYAHPKLDVTKDNFFKGDQVTYVYDHDTIHEVMKHNAEPAYKYFQKDGAQVACDKNKFFSCPEKVRLHSVLEESYVLALERSQIPFAGKVEPRQSFLMALSKVCSSITSGWWREYAYEHIFEVLNLYNENYVDRFKIGVETGAVKKL